MDVHFQKLVLPDESSLLNDWLTSETWPFHKRSCLTKLEVSGMLDEGLFDGENNVTFWILCDDKKAGLMRIFDLEDLDDGSPLFDIRIRSEFRGQGVGRIAVSWLTKFLFDTYPNLERIAGATRSDNLSMRNVFRKCGYAKEGHIRKDWRTPQGERYDSILYGILRSDWDKNTVTAVNWDDENRD